MNELSKFKQEVSDRVYAQGKDQNLIDLSRNWVEQSMKKQYVYNFSWLGRPIIQYPEDIIALQEIIWKEKPDVIIETGIAHGGSLIFSASMLKLLGGNRKVIGIDIDIRQHNKKEIENHPVSDIITMIEGSSISENVVEQVKSLVESDAKVMVILDSNHTHDHVRQELALYSPLVTPNQYLVVLDTFVEDMPKNFFDNRPWDVGNSPKTAVYDFLNSTNAFEIDTKVFNKLLISVAPDGFLKRVF